MGTKNFYSDLSVFDDFSVVSDLSSYKAIPSDWYVVAADIQNSTTAIKEGLYKAVNIVGVSVITSIRNAAKPILIPYIFGGDGATLCIPPSIVTKAEEALLATKKMAKEQFGLELRVGVIPVSTIVKEGYQVLIARHRMSEFYIQAAFAGGGIEFAEDLIKDECAGEQYRLDTNSINSDADYSGLECRWDNVYSQHGETIALIVKALSSSIEVKSKIYNEVIEKIRKIYGDDDLCRPVYPTGLQFTSNSEKLSHELKVRTFSRNIKNVIQHWLTIRLQIMLGWLLMTSKAKVSGISWGDYKKDVAGNSDFKKFDGVLREVISGTKEQRIALQDYLEQRYKNNECVYGIHASDSALVTCMINNRSGEHFHFVDGADGGYAMAASQMKQQLKVLSE